MKLLTKRNTAFDYSLLLCYHYWNYSLTTFRNTKPSLYFLALH